MYFFKIAFKFFYIALGTGTVYKNVPVFLPKLHWYSKKTACTFLVINYLYYESENRLPNEMKIVKETKPYFLTKRRLLIWGRGEIFFYLPAYFEHSGTNEYKLHWWYTFSPPTTNLLSCNLNHCFDVTAKTSTSYPSEKTFPFAFGNNDSSKLND